jgi:hypothetical protein
MKRLLVEMDDGTLGGGPSVLVPGEVMLSVTGKVGEQTSFTDLSIEPRRSRLGLAVYARAFVPAEAVLVRLGIGEITETRNFRTIELGEGAHEDHPYLRYVNHSCDPNSFIDKKDRVLRALRPIRPSEEITFDYLVNESEIASPFQCDCGAPNCRRLIRKERGK